MGQIRERNVEQYFVEQCEAQGWGVRKVGWIGRRDAPDRVVLIPKGRGAPDNTVWVELKKPGEKPRPSQTRELEWMASRGQVIRIISSYSEVDNFIEEWTSCCDGMKSRY